MSVPIYCFIIPKSWKQEVLCRWRDIHYPFTFSNRPPEQIGFKFDSNQTQCQRTEESRPKGSRTEGGLSGTGREGVDRKFCCWIRMRCGALIQDNSNRFCNFLDNPTDRLQYFLNCD